MILNDSPVPIQCLSPLSLAINSINFLFSFFWRISFISQLNFDRIRLLSQNLMERKSYLHMTLVNSMNVQVSIIDFDRLDFVSRLKPLIFVFGFRLHHAVY